MVAGGKAGKVSVTITCKGYHSILAANKGTMHIQGYLIVVGIALNAKVYGLSGVYNIVYQMQVSVAFLYCGVL